MGDPTLHGKKYLAHKKAKQEIYRKYGFNLIEWNDEHVQNLDDIPPKVIAEAWDSGLMKFKKQGKLSYYIFNFTLALFIPYPLQYWIIS